MWRYSCTVVLLCTIALGTDVVNALNSRLPVVLFGRPVGGFLNVCFMPNVSFMPQKCETSKHSECGWNDS
ncbi:unnamed protein product [Anisakis simplex]|uniref:Secreted protein n=1 Tax=Anisakis simplex TaxID=6269 RepID=A0A0M3JLH4_ANISI|nr:unnamed protein product [Anisakis simplex]